MAVQSRRNEPETGSSASYAGALHLIKRAYTHPSVRSECVFRGTAFHTAILMDSGCHVWRAHVDPTVEPLPSPVLPTARECHDRPQADDPPPGRYLAASTRTWIGDESNGEPGARDRGLSRRREVRRAADIVPHERYGEGQYSLS